MGVGFGSIFKLPSYSDVLIVILALIAIIFAGFSLLVFTYGWIFSRKYDYANKHVVITGGSSGIGLELAREYLKRGAKVTIAARNIDNLQSAKKDLEDSLATYLKSGKPEASKTSTSGLLVDLCDRINILSVDVSKSYELVESKLLEAVGHFGEVDVLVNCAGISYSGELEKHNVDEYEKLLRVNVLGSMYPTRFVLPSMKRRRSGRIIFVSSQIAQAAVHGFSAYAASKWALRGLAEALQMECKPYNIFISVSYPPDTDTPGYRQEMLTKPDLTKKISESGSVFSPKDIAPQIVDGSTAGYFGISNGLDGWLLKQLHPGMTPLNCFTEAWQQICFSGLARLISLFYLISWDCEIKSYIEKNDSYVTSKDNA